MSEENSNSADEYVPPKVWEWDNESGGRFANINRPVAGATHDKELPRGDNPLQLYSLATPNGVKVTALLEELLDLGHTGAEYDAYTINIGEGQQFGSGFVEINPNSKIPALLDLSTPTPTGCLNLVQSWSIWPKSSVRFCPLSHRSVLNACHGCSGRWEVRPI